MLSNYQVKYSETEEVLKDICRVNAVDKVMVNHRITVAMVGAASAIVIVNVTDYFAENPALKVFTYLALWILAFVAGEILGRTAGKKSAVSQGDVDGAQVYRQRLEKWGSPMEVKVEFYDTYFTTWVKGLQKQKVEYNNVTKLIESAETISIVARVEFDSRPRLYAFPKSGIQNVSEDVLKAFIIEKCPQVTKGFRTLEYKHK